MTQSIQTQAGKHGARRASPGNRTLLLVGLLCTLGAVLLRYYPSSMREGITLRIGAEGRALLEHILAGLGVPLCLHGFLLLAGGNAARAPAASWHTLPGAKALLALAVGLWRYAFLVWPAVYLVLSVRYELGQAWESVNGGQARGYVQYSQLLADAFGVAIAGVLGWRAAR